jgi:hypothetical protein
MSSIVPPNTTGNTSPPTNISGASSAHNPSNQTKSDMNNDHHNRCNRGTSNFLMSRLTQFEGKCTELEGHIYDCSNIRQYSQTTKEVAEYVGRTFKFGMDVCLSIEKLQQVVITPLDDPPPDSSRTDIRIWEKRIDDFVTRETILRETLKTTYLLILGQCTDLMRQRI